MVKVFIILGVMGLVLIGSLLLTTFLNPNNQEKEIKDQPNKVYSRPVPEGYDEPYFRKTGITKPLGENN